MGEPILVLLLVAVAVGGLVVGARERRHVTLWTFLVVAVGGVALVALDPAAERRERFGFVVAFGTPTVLALAFASSELARNRPLLLLFGAPAVWLLTFICSLSVAVGAGWLVP